MSESTAVVADPPHPIDSVVEPVDPVHGQRNPVSVGGHVYVVCGIRLEVRSLKPEILNAPLLAGGRRIGVQQRCEADRFSDLNFMYSIGRI